MRRGQAIKKLIAKSPWIPNLPTGKQLLFLTLPEREVFYGGQVGGGKALSLDTLLPTPSGWTTMADVDAGDTLYGADGKPCRVLATSPVMLDHDVYRVTLDDGSEVLADAEHLWHTKTLYERDAAIRRTESFRERRKANRPKRGVGKRPDLAKANAARVHELLPPPDGALRQTDELAHSVNIRGRTNHSIDQPKPLEAAYAVLPLDPYVLGAWLGDGTSASGGFTCADTGILDQIRARGFQVRAQRGLYQYGILGLFRPLRLMGLLGNKHIPAEYMRASVDQRLDLLAGLMDTDGSIAENGKCEFTATNSQIAYGAAELLRSLGIKCRVRESDAKLRGRVVSRRWRVVFRTTLPVFRLERKAGRLPATLRPTQDVRYVKSVELVKSVPVRCVQVERGMFLAGRGMVPTHNSDALLMGALLYADVPGYNAIIFRRTYPELSQADGLIHRSKQWLSGTQAVWNEGQMRWTFPSGATLRFAHMQREDDKFNYQGGQYQFIGWDELTGFTETQYTYLLSRLRKLRSSPVSLRVRSASNPGNIGHDWVYERFVIGAHPFVSASLDDNPHLSTEEYKGALAELDDITRAQLLEGKWVTATGEKPFKREYWRGKNRFSKEDAQRIANRCYGRWIFADTAQMDDEEAAYTVFIAAEVDRDYTMKIKDVWRGRPDFSDLPDEVVSFAHKHNGDGKLKAFVVEHASSGIQVLQVLKHTAPEWLKPILHGAKPLGKENGWSQAGVWCKRNMVHLPQPGPEVPWLFPFEEELYRLPNARFKDQGDALAMGVNRLKHHLAQRWLALGAA